jgi:hypothetical protein
MISARLGLRLLERSVMRHSRTAALAALPLCLGLVWAGGVSPAAARAVKTARHAKPAPAAQSVQSVQPVQAWPETVSQMAQWVIASGDNGALPFAIIDKVAAKVFVFRADGQLLGAAPALLGSARGDNSAPGVGDRELSDIAPGDRTTPAGRFVASYGSAREKHPVLWVDYTTAISMHPVVTAHPAERRPQRLRSATPRDNRITYGCINLTPAFYEKVVRRTFTGTTGIVYILPEKEPLQEAFPTFRIVASGAPTGEAPAAQEPKASGVSDATCSASAATALAR